MSVRLLPQHAVEAHDLVKVFGTTPALARVSLAVPAGSVCALVGGNGAGKTTLLRILATALCPTAGRAVVLGRDTVGERAQARRLVDLIPAAGGVYAELSGVENLQFATRMRGLALTEDELEGALARFDLARAREERAGTYSAGMLRRLSLARLALVRPSVALVDEPYGGLDEEGRELFEELLAECVREGRTVLVATHERERVERLADMVYRLERGLLVEPAHEASGAVTLA